MVSLQESESFITCPRFNKRSFYNRWIRQHRIVWQYFVFSAFWPEVKHSQVWIQMVKIQMAKNCFSFYLCCKLLLLQNEPLCENNFHNSANIWMTQKILLSKVSTNQSQTFQFQSKFFKKEGCENDPVLTLWETRAKWVKVRILLPCIISTIHEICHFCSTNKMFGYSPPNGKFPWLGLLNLFL